MHAKIFTKWKFQIWNMKHWIISVNHENFICAIDQHHITKIKHFLKSINIWFQEQGYQNSWTFFSLGWQHFHRMITTVPLLIMKIKRTTLFFVLISIENIKTRKSNFYEDNMVSRMHIWCIKRNVSLILINYIKKFQSLKTHKYVLYFTNWILPFPYQRW